MEKTLSKKGYNFEDAFEKVKSYNYDVKYGNAESYENHERIECVFALGINDLRVEVLTDSVANRIIESIEIDLDSIEFNENRASDFIIYKIDNGVESLADLSSFEYNKDKIEIGIEEVQGQEAIVVRQYFDFYYNL